MNDRCDVLVVGGGHAGVEAARAASFLGLDVILLKLGEVVLTTCRPDPKRQLSLGQVAEMVEGGQSITLLFGIGPHGVPKDVMRIPRYNLDITPGGFSLETATALGAVTGALASRLRMI